jgi:hypothetical protein
MSFLRVGLMFSVKGMLNIFLMKMPQFLSMLTFPSNSSVLQLPDVTVPFALFKNYPGPYFLFFSQLPYMLIAKNTSKMSPFMRYNLPSPSHLSSLKFPTYTS